MPPKRKPKKIKAVRDPGAYATVSLPSRASREDSRSTQASAAKTAPAADIDIIAESSALPPTGAIFGSDSATTGEEAVDRLEDGCGNGGVATWVAIDLAQRQADTRINHELYIKERMSDKGPVVTLSDKSEQLVVNGIRSGNLALPLPDVDQMVPVKDWTRSANFVFETLLKYKFEPNDIKAAMEALKGTGDILDMLAWLCFNVPADRLPADMRDKFEFDLIARAHCQTQNSSMDKAKADVAEEQEATHPPIDRFKNAEEQEAPIVSGNERTPQGAKATDAKPSKLPARIDDAADLSTGSGSTEEDALAKAFEKLGLDSYNEDEYDSDEDPGVVHARRSVRLKAFEEWLEYLKPNNQRNRYKENIGSINRLASQERRILAEIEDDWLFDEAQAAQEFETLWLEYYDVLLDEIRAFKESEEELEALVKSYELIDKSSKDCESNDKQPKEEAVSPDIFDDSDSNSEGGFGLGFVFGDEDDGGQTHGQTSLSTLPTRIIDTTAPAGWTGAPIKDILLEFVRRLDSQSTVKYNSSAAGAGHTCTAALAWASPTQASAHASPQREVPIQPKPEFASSGLVCSWTLPSGLVGKTRRDAENLVSLVALYMLSNSSQMGKRLPPALRKEWEVWEQTQQQIDENHAAELHEARSAFLGSLRGQYEVAVKEALATRATNDSSSKNRLPNKTFYSRRAQNIRARKWTHNLVPERQQSEEWKDKYSKVQESLPSRKFRREIVGALVGNQVVIIRGDTGCGKSTQVPQYALELLLASNYKGGRIICTQPRRISATSIATRVSQEVGDPGIGSGNSLVGYQIRFNSHTADENVLVFCTTGVLLRTLAEDPLLQGVNCIICDEVQERTLELDYLLIVLRQLLSKRPDLKIILMSATIDTTIFSFYFDNCPVVDIPGHTFPVQSIFLENIVQMSEYALDKHSKFAVRANDDMSGGDGSSSSSYTSHTLAISSKGGNTYRETVNVWDDETQASDIAVGSFNQDMLAEDPDYVSAAAWSVVNRMRTDIVNLDLICRIIRDICSSGDTASASTWSQFCKSSVPDGAILVFLPGIYEIRALASELSSDGAVAGRATVIPLHSVFANEIAPNTTMTYTDLAFAPSPKDKRKIVLATNVAETGITIPDVTVVLDSGMSNQAQWDKKRRVIRLETKPVSKANVKQRRGRAGRVKPGLSLCLFSSTRYNSMPEFELPEMQRLPLVNVCLMTKTHGVRDIMRFLQQALEPPQQSSTMQAIHELKEAGALDEEENLTPIGRHLCYLPLDLSVGKMLIVGALLNCLDPVLTIAASLSQNNNLLVVPYDQDARALAMAAHAKYRKASPLLPFPNDKQASDFLVILAAYADWRREASKAGVTKRELYAFCKKNWLSQDAFDSLEDLREQYLRLLYDLGLVKITRHGTSKDLSLHKTIRPRLDNSPGFRSGFTAVPKESNANGDNVNVIYAAIIAGLEHIVMPSGHGGFEIGQTNVTKKVRGIGHAIQIIDREHVSTRPILVDRRSVAARDDAPLPSNNALVAATLSGTSNSTYANMITKVNLAAVVLFSRSLNYWPKAKQLIINRWIEGKCYAKTASILILLRGLLEEIIQFKVAYPLADLPEDLAKWQDVIISVLRSESV